MFLKKKKMAYSLPLLPFLLHGSSCSVEATGSPWHLNFEHTSAERLYLADVAILT